MKFLEKIYILATCTMLIGSTFAEAQAQPEKAQVFQGYGAIAVPLSQEAIVAPGWLREKLAQGDSTAILGYHVYRKEAGLAWQKLTKDPVRMSEKERFKTAFGDSIFVKMADGNILENVQRMAQQSVVFANMSPEDRVWTFLENNTDVNELGYLALATELYPYLGLIYLDSTALPGIEYQYSIRPITLRGEGEMQGRGSIAFSTVSLLPVSLLKIDGTFKKKDIRLEIEYFPRQEIRFIQVYRLQEGKEPLLIARTSAQEPSISLPRASEVVFDENVQLGEIYRYRAYGADEWGNLSIPLESKEILALDPSQDYYVTNATFTSLGDEGLEWSWEQDNRFVYYKGMTILRASAFDGEYKPLATVPYHQLRWRDTTVKPETQYFYRFQRVYSNGDTSLRSPYFTASFELLQPPLPPKDILPVATKEGIRLTWKRPDSKYSPLTYFVLRSTDGVNFLQVATVDSSTYSFVDTASYFYPYAKVYYQIRPVNASLVMGEPSQAVEILPYLDSLRLEPTALWNVFINDEDRVHIKMSDYSTVYPYITGYNVYRRRKSAPVNEVVKINEQPLSAPDITDIVAKYGEEYAYSYSLVDLRGFESIRSEERSITVAAKEHVYPPMTKIVLQYQGEDIVLRWQPVEHQKLTGYIILRAERNGSYTEVARLAPEAVSWGENIPRKTVLRYKVLPVFGNVVGTPATEVTALR